MARPKQLHPTPAELEVLNILWEQGPSTVREVIQGLPTRRQRGYTTVMSLLNVMFDKGLLNREPDGRAFRYSPRAKKSKTLKAMLGDLLGRAFDGSSSSLVTHLLEQATPNRDELDAIRAAIESYEQENEVD